MEHEEHWVVLIQKPYYPEIHFFGSQREAEDYAAEEIECHDGGSYEGFIFVGYMSGLVKHMKTYY